jgi:hypothetical protein
VPPPRGADHAASGSPDPATRLASGVFPMADSRQPARGSRTGGASGSLAFASTVVALGSPWPSRSPHRVDSGAFSGARVPRPRVLLSCSTIPARAGLVVVVIVPTGLLDRSRSISPSAHRGCPRRAPFELVVRCLVRVSKDRPSTVSRAEESTSREHVAVIASETGRQPASCAAFVVWTTVTVCSSPTLPGCCTGPPVMGFVMFHRRDSEFPPRIPALRSFALCAQQTAVGSLLRSVGLRHPPRSPWSVHREPCPLALGRRLRLAHADVRTSPRPGRTRCLNLEAFLHPQSRDPSYRCRREEPAAPLGLPGRCPPTLAGHAASPPK